MNARRGSYRVDARKDRVQFGDIHGAMATRLKSVEGRLDWRVTFLGKYWRERL
jgi:hypothetical protein